MRRVQCVVHIREDVHLWSSRARTGGPLELICLRKIKTDIKVTGTNLAVLDSPGGPVIARSVFVVILPGRDCVEPATLRLQYGGQVNIERQLGINVCGEVVPRIYRIA